MRYFIGYLIGGEAGEWHRNVAIELSQKFGTWDIYDRVPSHVTIYKPFDTDSVEDVKIIIRSFLSSHPLKGTFLMSGFDRFDDKVIYADIRPDRDVLELVMSLRHILQDLPISGADYYPDNWHPHATLMRLVGPELIDGAWRHLEGHEKPLFQLPFNNITLFRSLGDRRWEVEETFR